MKWFNFDKYFVVVLEDGDVYGPESNLEYRAAEPSVRLFDKSHIYRNNDGYPLLAESSLSTLARQAERWGTLDLADGSTLEPELTAALYRFTYTLLLNSGALVQKERQLAA
ncbi:MAG: hypothetical protein R3208_01925 [Ketobacteraceae bacterium]|nr:hypothetical protein [Ketobacteraceae bacterium]